MQGDYETRSAAIYPEDAVLLPEIYSDFQKNKATGKPYFSFSVNVQSHGPYATWDTGSPDCFADETYSLACRNAMNYYLATIWETDRELAKLMDWLRDDEEPVVLVTFGDHLPWMGDHPVFHEAVEDDHFVLAADEGEGVVKAGVLKAGGFSGILRHGALSFRLVSNFNVRTFLLTGFLLE